MFRRILVLLDGSASAEDAIPVAARLARVAHGSIILFQAVSATDPSSPAFSPEQSQMCFDPTRELALAEGSLARLRLFPELQDVSVEAVAYVGSPFQTIHALVCENAIDLIILCSPGKTSSQRWMRASLIEKLVRETSVPLLLLPEGGPIPAHPHPDPTQRLRVMVALDGSLQSKAALLPAAQVAAALASPRYGALHLTRVIAPFSEKNAVNKKENQARIVQRVRRYLSQMAERLRKGMIAPEIADLDLLITWSLVIEDAVAQALLRVAKNGESAGRSDLIALTTHGHEGSRRQTMGKVAEQMVYETPLPLLIVPPRKPIRKYSLIWKEKRHLVSSQY